VEKFGGEHLIGMQINWLVYLIDLAATALLGYCIFQIEVTSSINTKDFVFYIRYYAPKDKKHKVPRIYVFEPTSILEANKDKKFIPVILTTDVNENQKKLDFIRFEAKRLKYTNDTNQILKVFIPDCSKYGTFLSLLLMMNEDQHKKYFEYQNWFYIFGEASFKEVKTVKEIPAIEL
jgi:hypothetical protein